MTTAHAAANELRAALTDARLATLTEALRSERAEQAELVAGLDATTAEVGGQGGADAIVTREMSGAAAARARQAVDEIDAALARVQDGTYGVCQHCGAAIPFERLEAMPATRWCVRCAATNG